MKNKRQSEILSIIEEVDVETQDHLLSELKIRGITATQATISRDIRELHLVKEMMPNGIYKYTVSERNSAGKTADRLRNIFKNGALSFHIAQNVVIINTMSGLANGVAAAIDGMDIDGFVGSLAGDDTVALFMKNNKDAERLCREIADMLQ